MKNCAVKKLAKILTDIFMTAILVFLANREKRHGCYASCRFGSRAFCVFRLASFFEHRVFQIHFQGQIRCAQNRACGDKCGFVRGDAFDGGEFCDDFRACI